MRRQNAGKWELGFKKGKSLRPDPIKVKELTDRSH
jgi:hypothetical protein